MASCPKCGKEIAEGASVCKHCHAEIATPKRPTGVTVIAVLTLLGSAGGLLTMLSLNEMNSIILGLRVPVVLARIETLVFAGVGIYCGIGFLRQKALARKIYIWVVLFGIINTLISTPVLINSMPLPDHVKGPTMISSMIGGPAIFGWILFYLIRRKDYFTN